MRFRIWGVLEPYLRALEWAGASVVIVPPQPQKDLLRLLPALDGLLLPGGIDIDPLHYNQEPHPDLGEVNAERDTLDLFLARYAAQNGLPTLGICRGIQVMNVALGGSLYQDLPSQGFRQVQHYQKSEAGVLGHTVEQAAHSPLLQWFEPRFQVNSYHHQALQDLAPGLSPIANAPDGVVEAVLLEDHPFFLGVQWHPEILSSQWAIFRALVGAAEQTAQA